MAIYDRISTLFWICLALAICIESMRLGLGVLSNPGPGLVPFSSGLLLGICGAIVFWHSFKEIGVTPVTLWGGDTCWGRMVAVIVSLVLAGFLIDVLGFLMTTMLWVGFLARGLGRMGWRGAILMAIATTIFSFLLFEYILGIRFPRGVWSP